MPLSVGTKLGPYEIIGPLDNGSLGDVYRARDTELDREVVIKALPDSVANDTERLGRFEREAKVLASVNHPNIASIYGLEESAGGKAVVMELVEGTTLKSPLPLTEALSLAVQIAEALEAAHEHGVTHGSLKPANIIVTQAGLVKVDFGFPANGDQADPNSDILSFGSILAEMLGAGTQDEEQPAAVREVVARAVASGSASRFGSAGEMAAVLKEQLDAARELHQTLTLDDPPAIETLEKPDSFFSVEGQRRDSGPPSNEPRYVDLGLLGKGGMGEVRRVRDRALNRVLAMKIMKPEADWLRTRFIQEARITAQLEHPAIVPVHEIGRLTDGRFYFTMKEVQGHTLAEVIKEAHAHWRVPEENRTGETSWTLRQLVGILQRAAEGVGYAHDRGVLHRDLKPANIMIGAFGEVLVVDWGLTRVGQAPPTGSVQSDQASDGDPITDSTRGEQDKTRFGAIMGTPRFMAPEQASGDSSRINVCSDVFSLGCVLYNILAGAPPYDDPKPIQALLAGRAKELGPRAGGEHGPLIPAELREICRRAMEFDPVDRHRNGSEFANAVAAWLDGAQRREQAMRVLDQARELKPQSQGIIREAEKLDRHGAEILSMVPPFAPVEAKRAAWGMQDRAAELRNEAEALSAQFIHIVHAALSLVDDLAPAHDLLAEHYKERHARAETARDETAIVQYETSLRVHDTGRFAAYLKGDGALTLVTDPPGARATLYRFESSERRMQPQLVGELGPTPIRARSIPMGSYVVKLSLAGRADVDYPVFIERELHWDGTQPLESEPHPIYLPVAGELRAEERYVPAGWFWSGGDPKARNSLPARKLWLDAFVTPRFPVTVAEYLTYLNALASSGRMTDAEAALPAVPEWEDRARAKEREFGFSPDASGRFVFDGGPDRLRLPMVLLSWHQSKAYGEWLAQHEGQPWHLIQEMEHEKASRGVDGRYFPWGNYLDPTFCAMRDSHTGSGRALRCTIDEYPLDESPYGVRGCAGNTHAWCEDAYSPAGPEIVNGIPRPPDPASLRGPGAGGAHRMVRGGSYRDPDTYCRTSFRDCPPAIFRINNIGFRVARFMTR